MRSDYDRVRGHAVCMLLALTFSLNSHAAETIHVWVNAFIPKTHPQLPDYITPTAAGTYVLKAPDKAAASPIQQERALVGTCFLTDNRLFATDPLASSRLSVEFDLVVEGRNLSIKQHDGRQIIRASPSTNVECASGKVLSEKPNDNLYSEVGDVKKSDFMRSVFLKASAGNPYFAASPKIDVTMSIQFFVMDRSVDIKGTIGNFPSFEGYYQLNDGAPVKIMNTGPAGASTADNLIDANLGFNSRNFSQTIKLGRPQ